MASSVAIIGAGISGLTCGLRLRQAGYSVVLFEKSRGVGGRVAQRRAPQNIEFDHGAQYFTVQDPRFESVVASWQEQRLVDSWDGLIGTLRRGQWQRSTGDTVRYVGTPAMTSIAKHLAQDLQVLLQTKVGQVQFNAERRQWQLLNELGRPLGTFDAVVVSTPAAQAVQLLPNWQLLQAAVGRVVMAPCWTVLLAYEESLGFPLDGAFVQDSPLSWIARNNSKPRRSALPECWVLHGSPSWSRENIEMPSDEVVRALRAAFWEAAARPLQSAQYTFVHRWRYALPVETLPERFLFDPDQGLAACGDWCGGPRVEGAYLSGLELAEAMLSA
ncbi:MAG: NAD(P)/FAD-dependent oxidoreductase [Planctomycetota bacterium]